MAIEGSMRYLACEPTHQVATYLVSPAFAPLSVYLVPGVSSNLY